MPSKLMFGPCGPDGGGVGVGKHGGVVKQIASARWILRELHWWRGKHIVDFHVPTLAPELADVEAEPIQRAAHQRHRQSDDARGITHNAIDEPAA